MQNIHTLVVENFFKYLDKLPVSRRTVRSYKSDFWNFYKWIATNKGDGLYVVFSKESPSLVFDQYKEYLRTTDSPRKTVNRRLSSLRHFSRFMRLQGLVDERVVQGISNVPLSDIERGRERANPMFALVGILAIFAFSPILSQNTKSFDWSSIYQDTKLASTYKISRLGEISDIDSKKINTVIILKDGVETLKGASGIESCGAIY